MTGGPMALLFVSSAWPRATDRLFLMGAAGLAVIETAFALLVLAQSVL